MNAFDDAWTMPEAAAAVYKERRAKAEYFNYLVDLTIKDLTMSPLDFSKIKSRLIWRRRETKSAKASRIDTDIAVWTILEGSHNYLSSTQACELAQAFSPQDLASGDSYMDWGSFGDWMHGLMLEEGGCVFHHGDRATLKPPADVLGHEAYPQLYHGLDWSETYTYDEAFPRIAKVLIGRLGKTSTHYNVGDSLNVRYAASDAIVLELKKRAQQRAAAHYWGRLAKRAPLIGRLSLAFKEWYLETSLRPGRGSVWLECRERFERAQ